jgi:hypothetical protein
VDDEHEFGWPEMMNQSSAIKSLTGCISLPGGSWAEPGRADEPSLAAPETGTFGSQVGWARGDRFDREVQCEDEGVDTDREKGSQDEGTDETVAWKPFTRFDAYGAPLAMLAGPCHLVARLLEPILSRVVTRVSECPAQ